MFVGEGPGEGGEAAWGSVVAVHVANEVPLPAMRVGARDCPDVVRVRWD